MWKRTLFFWMESLQITAGERRVLLTLMALVMIITVVSELIPGRTVYDLEYYSPVIEEFRRLSGIEEQQREVLLARYYPPGEKSTTVTGVLELVNEYPRIPLVLSGTEPASEHEQHDAPDDEDGRQESHGTKVDIQSAGIYELTTLPGIGTVTAEQIIRFREQQGPFQQPEDLLQVSGIGPVTLENIRDHISIGE